VVSYHSCHSTGLEGAVADDEGIEEDRLSILSYTAFLLGAILVTQSHVLS
jgi:hypothetical protein